MSQNGEKIEERDPEKEGEPHSPSRHLSTIWIAAGVLFFMCTLYRFFSQEKTWAPFIRTFPSMPDNGPECRFHPGTLDDGRVKYIYHSPSENCDVSAELNALETAVMHRITHSENVHIRHTKCIDLTHGKLWNGYLLIGPASDFDSDMYCGPKLPFQPCDSDGEENTHGGDEKMTIEPNPEELK